MTSIFDVHDGDEMRGRYEVPGTNLEVVVEVVMGARFWIERANEFDSHLPACGMITEGVHGACCEPMVELGRFLLDLERQEA